jgi:hypothetical protein
VLRSSLGKILTRLAADTSALLLSNNVLFVFLSDTTMVGCIYPIPTDMPAYYTFRTTKEDRIAVYMTAESPTSILCHPMGIRANTKTNFVRIICILHNQFNLIQVVQMKKLEMSPVMNT